MDYVIETNGPTKRHGNKIAVDHMSVHVKGGDIYGLIEKTARVKRAL